MPSQVFASGLSEGTLLLSAKFQHPDVGYLRADLHPIRSRASENDGKLCVGSRVDFQGFKGMGNSSDNHKARRELGVNARVFKRNKANFRD